MAQIVRLNPSIVAQVKRYEARLRMAGIPLEKLIVFGSYAKGSAKPWSDVDVCVVSKAFGADRHAERVALMHLQDDETMDIEPHPYSPTDLSDQWDSLAHEIRTYGIAVS